MNPLQIEYKQTISEPLPEYITSTTIPGLFTIERPVFGDDRGDFWEVARVSDLEAAIGRPFKIAQINRSRNNKKGVLRGLHVADWDKLITVIRGSVFIVLVDLRLNSPTYGKAYTRTIGENNTSVSVLIPAGFGNSYQTLEDNTDYLYAVTDLWAPGREVGINWNDPDLKVEWPIQAPILSEKDTKNAFLKDLIPGFADLRK